MMTYEIDVADCLTAENVYGRLLTVLQAPDWHGHNLDALWDSVTSDINGLMPPYSIAVKGHEQAPVLVTELLCRIQAVFEDAVKNESIDVEFRLV